MTDLDKVLGQSKEPELAVFVKWMEFLKWLLPVSDKMPKKVRFYTLGFSFALEQTLRRSNKNPAALRAQLVRYSENNSTWEILEIAVAAQGDTSSVVEPFYRLNAQMKEMNGGYGYVIIDDISTQFSGEFYPQEEIGGFTLRDQLLDLCSGSYADLCKFDYDSMRADFDIFAWLQ